MHHCFCFWNSDRENKSSYIIVFFWQDFTIRLVPNLLLFFCTLVGAAADGGGMLMLLIVTEGVHREIEEEEKWGRLRQRAGGREERDMIVLIPLYPLSSLHLCTPLWVMRHMHIFLKAPRMKSLWVRTKPVLNEEGEGISLKAGHAEQSTSEVFCPCTQEGCSQT